MPKVICSIHNGQPGFLVCGHLAENVRQKRPVVGSLEVTAEIEGYDLTARFCSECVEQWKLTKHVGSIPEDWSTPGAQAFETTVPVCQICLNELNKDQELNQSVDR